ncbi:uncharacterized protein BKA55DRAFT_696700 [Fusarium redolens]|uniref:Dienelactone hydrolase domain-containing protein n=1 Tax=Fusarium redolens TaxID=48865 RepID=A0A9P9G2P5_FUSRE|nr:uncharacterized protein BKA55DRAFT_696700 [Fusarium redolens]KAH7230167.1 hypothetical protein BKA55DRAFT_696700 [Fusarium redolens]
MVDVLITRGGLVGICAGGGYAVGAAKGDHRFKAVSIADEKAAALDQVAQAVQAEAAGNEPVAAPYAPPTLDDNTPYDLKEAYEYYLTARGQHPNAQNKMLLRSTGLVINFDAWLIADIFLTQPLLIVVGEKAESRWHSEKIYKILDGKNKALKKVVVPNARHMDFYDKEDYINPAIEKIVNHLSPNN